jgi:RNA polymerase sigma-70 factor, ECF subfamily
MSESRDELRTLETLFEAHRPRLLAMVERRMPDVLSRRLDPEEILQEAFVAARDRYEAFLSEGRMAEYPWLYRITLDRLLDAWRRETSDKRDGRRENAIPDKSSVQLGLGLMANLTSPSMHAVRDELVERMRDAMSALKDEDREILWMRQRDELSYREIAAVLGINENAAAVRHVRALKRLRDVWQTICPEWEGSR